ncbi:hypothetical protein G6R40_03315 [Chryseobacterium sp. POL2]|uniref:hypothetical protein n=1 Tax=Chryseobacterium sp. POL2 TaxID=2713414 RepID=UPI0013E15F13|nr:hypothetical protein [Chryseobacterium sp. POL2]QIG88758.1 hypothetical protein G6R40_03315 [Chryseobacterium sp. POL2]
MKTKLLFLLFLFLTTKLSFAQLNCYQQSNNLHQYYAKLEHISNLNIGFDKTDFINYVTTYSNLTTENLSILDTDVISVSKSFPSSQTAFLQNVVSIDSNSDIYSILLNSNNSISTIECRNNPILLNTPDFELNNLKFAVTKNPIDENSKIIVHSKIKNFILLISNSVGQTIHKKQYTIGENILINSLVKEKGLYILTIIDAEKKHAQSLKVVK